MVLLALFFLSCVARYGMRIVLVDDDRDWSEVVSLRLTKMGNEVRHVPNGLRLVSALKVWCPDVLLIDVRMSWIDGIALTRSLKQNELFRRVPVVVMSAQTSVSVMGEAIEAGAECYISKPFSIGLLQMRLEEIASRSEEAPRAG